MPIPIMCAIMYFPNAQTGNVVLMSQHIISGDMRSALRYLVPLVSFVLGV